MLILELISSTASLYGKYLWVNEKEIAWLFAMIGSFAAGLLAYLNGLNIWMTLEIYSFFFFAYGYYKWKKHTEKLDFVDVTAIALTLVFITYFTYSSINLISFLQLVMSICFILAALILSVNKKLKTPWVLFFLGHCMLFYISFAGGLFVFAFFQVLSIFNAAYGFLKIRK
jgi:hypothetical protein